jgi:hypothetical protein
MDEVVRYTYRLRPGHAAENAARVILAVAERGHVGVDDVRQSDSPPSEMVSAAA